MEQFSAVPVRDSCPPHLCELGASRLMVKLPVQTKRLGRTERMVLRRVRIGDELGASRMFEPS